MEQHAYTRVERGTAFIANDALACRIATITGELMDLRGLPEKHDWLSGTHPLVTLAERDGEPARLNEVTVDEGADEHGVELTLNGRTNGLRVRCRIYAFHRAPALWMRLDVRNLREQRKTVTPHVPWSRAFEPALVSAEIDAEPAALAVRGPSNTLVIAPAQGGESHPPELDSAHGGITPSAQKIASGMSQVVLSVLLVVVEGDLNEMGPQTLERTRRIWCERAAAVEARMVDAEQAARDSGEIKD